MKKLIFVDCEAIGGSPVTGQMSEFGAVDFETRKTFHGIWYDAHPNPENSAVPIIEGLHNGASAGKLAQEFVDWLDELGKGRAIFVSDNVAYDWQWIAAMFAQADIENPFGHSGRRISDFYAGLQNDWFDTQSWKRYRVTKHTHNPVDDAMGNVEAFEKILQLAKDKK